MQVRRILGGLVLVLVALCTSGCVVRPLFWDHGGHQRHSGHSGYQGGGERYYPNGDGSRYPDRRGGGY